MTDREARLEAIRAEASRHAATPDAVSGYFGRPVVKAPVWTWEIPVYFFVGGAAGASALIALVAGAAGAREVAVHARWVAAIGALLSAPLLVADLGRPWRFLNMLRVLKFRSPMSVGAWALALFMPAALASLLRIGGLGTDLLAAAAGLLLATYTGVLIGATAIPIWSRHARLLPLHFGASALGAAVSLIELTGPRPASLNLIGIAAAAVETMIGVRLELQRQSTARSLFVGAAGAITRIGAVLSGPVPLVLRMLASGSAAWRITAAVSTAAGSLSTRVGWVAAGRALAVPSVVAAFLVLRLPWLAANAAAVQQPTDDLVAQGSAYVVAYQRQLTYLLANEDYEQERLDSDHRRTTQRKMRGELFLTWAGTEWTAVHDFAEVDGQPVADRQDLQTLLSGASVSSVARRLKDYNSRFNIGGVIRNFSEPTLALQVLEPRHAPRFAFSVRQRSREGSTAIATLGFEERNGPTLIIGRDGHPIYSSGEFTLEAGSGRIRRVQLIYADGPLSGELTTIFQLDARIGLWLPTQFRERYIANRGGRQSETITGVALYSNYHRFEATSRIR